MPNFMLVSPLRIPYTMLYSASAINLFMIQRLPIDHRCFLYSSIYAAAQQPPESRYDSLTEFLVLKCHHVERRILPRNETRTNAGEKVAHQSVYRVQRRHVLYTMGAETSHTYEVVPDRQFYSAWTDPNPSETSSPTRYREAAHAFFAKAFRTVSRRAFFASMTLKRSKSVRFLRAVLAARFFAQADCSHFATIPDFSSFAFTAELPAARGSLGTTRVVRVR
jgi:hypothetical protein